jgi:single-strand DNA-binding protein
MLNEAQISLTGYVATQPVTRTVKTGGPTVSMRVAWTPRRQDRVTGEWVDGSTSYVTVNCWRRLATNVAICVRKGDPVVVKGRLSVRPYEGKDGMARTAVEVEASSVGHDLSRGVASFQRVRPATGMTASEFAASQAGDHANGATPALGGGPDGSGGSAGLADLAAPVRLLAGAGALAPLDESGAPLPDEPDEFFDDSAIGDSAFGDGGSRDSEVGDSAAELVHAHGADREAAHQERAAVPF